MTPLRLYRSTWIPHPPPDGPCEEVMAPWTALGFVLTCVVDDGGDHFVLARRGDAVVLSWKVLP